MNGIYEVHRRTMNAKEAACYIGISYWGLLQLAKRGEIPHLRLGRRLLFTTRLLDEWLEVSSGKELRRA